MVAQISAVVQDRRQPYAALFLFHVTSSLLLLDPLDAFSTVPPIAPLLLRQPPALVPRTAPVVCAAANKKAAGGRKSSPRRSAGGFGGAPAAGSSSLPSSPPQQDGDYSVFPRLESRVLETLVPVPASMMASTADGSGGGLPLEIYQRLDQIYGLPNFNYETTSTPTATTTGANVASPVSLSDMLSVVDGVASEEGGGGTPDPDPSPLDWIPPFSKLRVLHVDPLVLAVDDFFTPSECDSYVARSLDDGGQAIHAQSPTVGKDAAARAQRTSTTWYHRYSNVPELMAKATRLLGLDSMDRWEEPQTVRYRRSEKFTWHLDALGPAENQPHLGGQRIATLLVYLTDLLPEDGGATFFRDLSSGIAGMPGPLKVRPRKGSALLFFPSAGGIPDTPFDIRTLHCGEAVAKGASQDKWIGQLWLRHGVYRSASAPPPGHNDDRTAAERAVAEYCQGFR